jgi:RhtB (resistance to homoserine/threonine) family protein
MLEQYASEFIALAIIHFLAVVAPGPDFTITVRQSITYGRATGLITSLGIGAGISVHVIYTVLGVGLIVSQSDIVFLVAKVIGAAYLTYLGINLIRTKKSTASLDVDEKTSISMSGNKAFLIGFMTNALNPKATLFFLAVFTTVVSKETPLSVQAVYGIWMCSVNATWFALVSLLFSHKKIRSAFLSVGHWFERIMGGVLIGFAAKLAFAIR